MAFSIVMERHAEPVYRFVRSLGAPPDDAEDALQECFVSAWRGADAFSGTGSARAWLLSIARNAVRRRHRRRAGQPERIESLDELGERAGWGSPTEFLPRFEAWDELEWALAQLSAEEREVVVLRELEGLTGAETAAAMGISTAAMKSRLHRGRLHLMGILREGAGNDA